MLGEGTVKDKEVGRGLRMYCIPTQVERDDEGRMSRLEGSKTAVSLREGLSEADGLPKAKVVHYRSPALGRNRRCSVSPQGSAIGWEHPGGAWPLSAEVAPEVAGGGSGAVNSLLKRAT